MKHFSKPLSLYEIDVLHYTSVGSDKQYFVDALIMKAIDEEGNPRGNDERRNALSDGGGSILDSASRTNSFGSEELNNRAEGPPPSG